MTSCPLLDAFVHVILFDESGKKCFDAFKLPLVPFQGSLSAVFLFLADVVESNWVKFGYATKPSQRNSVRPLKWSSIAGSGYKIKLAELSALHWLWHMYKWRGKRVGDMCYRLFDAEGMSTKGLSGSYSLQCIVDSQEQNRKKVVSLMTALEAALVFDGLDLLSCSLTERRGSVCQAVQNVILVKIMMYLVAIAWNEIAKTSGLCPILPVTAIFLWFDNMTDFFFSC